MSTTKKRSSKTKAPAKAPPKKAAGKRVDENPPDYLGDNVVPQVRAELVPALNHRHTTAKEPALGDIDLLVYGIIAKAPEWVLIDRHVFSKLGQSSSRYIALRRRGFEVAARHVGQIKNYWARWPHPEPGLPMVAEYEGDDGESYGGMIGSFEDSKKRMTRP